MTFSIGKDNLLIRMDLAIIKHANEASRSIVQKSEEEPKYYANTLKNSIKSEENKKKMNDDQ